MSASAAANRLGIEVGVAAEIVRSFLSTFPAIKPWLSSIKQYVLSPSICIDLGMIIYSMVSLYAYVDLLVLQASKTIRVRALYHWSQTQFT